MLAEATQIRIIGYSLPDSDAYIKFLLKAAGVRARNLKAIDVFCRDSNGQVEKRFNDFVSHPNYTFRKTRTEDYLGVIFETYQKRKVENQMKFDALELAHKSFLDRTASP